MAAQMGPCLDHEAVDCADRHAEPSSDLGMGQSLNANEQKGIVAGWRQFGKRITKPCKLHRGTCSGFRTGWRHRIGTEIEGLARMAQSDLGLTREIHHKIGGCVKEIGARLFEGSRGASLEETEKRIVHDIFSFLAANAAPREAVQFAGVRLI
jgi:hypothetical protein